MTATFVTTSEETQHTLVVVFLRGGADGLTMVPPRDDDGYHRARPQLRVDARDTLRLDDRFGLNPHLAPLHPLYLEGHLAVVHAVGSEDDTRSHFEAQDLMEHGGHAAGGWLGRYLRNLPRAASSPLAAVALGTAAPKSMRGAPASVVLDSFDTFAFGDDGAAFLAQLEQLYARDRSELAQVGRGALTAVRKLQELSHAAYRPANAAAYTNDDFGDGMARIAQLVKSGVGVEAATIDLNGWDSHFAQAPLIHPKMRILSANLAAFTQDLGPALNRVTVVVMSEFGRRVFENASFGTDHGRAGLMFVLGGGIRGGRVYGEWPGLDSGVLEGPGDVPVTTNYRDVLAPILQRCGGLHDVSPVFPDFTLSPRAMYA